MSSIAQSYASTLYNIALKHTSLQSIYMDTCKLLDLYTQSINFRFFIKSPTLTKQKKQTLLQQSLKPYLNPTTLSFILFIFEKRRYTHFKNIFEAFKEQYKKHNKIQKAYVTTTKPINPSLKKQLIQLTTKITGHIHIELIEYINPALLGGYILKINDRQIDASLATKIKHLKYLISS